MEGHICQYTIYPCIYTLLSCNYSTAVCVCVCVYAIYGVSCCLDKYHSGVIEYCIFPTDCYVVTVIILVLLADILSGISVPVCKCRI